MDIDCNLTYAQLSKEMGIEIRDGNVPAHLIKIMLGFEKGEINTETFLWNLQKESVEVRLLKVIYLKFTLLIQILGPKK